ncbi:hypothetical protein GF377_10145 [candidate division GN15 bacterium]|nr:hypothetical protein [candidate division GN15 bacterium]
MAARTKYSLAFVLALAIGFAIMPGKEIHSSGIAEVPVREARGGEVLFVDGNRDGYGVAFKHDFHADTLGGDASCVKCHHMNMPQDQNSGCYNCHSDMYSTTSAFNHDWHASPSGANVKCVTCHIEGMARSAESAMSCDGCHTDLVPEGALITFETHWAPSYSDAMHDQCIGCHQETLAERPDITTELTRCATCHTTPGPEYLREEMKDEILRPNYNKVVMPGYTIETDEDAGV